MDHHEAALSHLEKAKDASEVELATVHALLHLADAVRHGLRDLVYELRS